MKLGGARRWECNWSQVLGQWIFPRDGMRGFRCKEHVREMDVLREEDWLVLHEFDFGVWAYRSRCNRNVDGMFFRRTT